MRRRVVKGSENSEAQRQFGFSFQTKFADNSRSNMATININWINNAINIYLIVIKEIEVALKLSDL